MADSKLPGLPDFAGTIAGTDLFAVDEAGTLKKATGTKVLADLGIQVAPSEGAFANGDKTKLDGIATGATAVDLASPGAIGGTTPAAGTFTIVTIGDTTLDGTTLADPNTDRLMFWDDSVGTIAYLTDETGLTIAVTFGSINLGHASDTTIARASAGLISVDGVNLAPNLPQRSVSAATTLTIADANTHLYHPSADTTARTWTIPANASVAFPIGTAVTFVNDISAGVLTIAITTDTLAWMNGASSATGPRTLAAGGMATAVKVTATRWAISGVGLT